MFFSNAFEGTLYILNKLSLCVRYSYKYFFPRLFWCFDFASGDFCNSESLLFASFILYSSLHAFDDTGPTTESTLSLLFCTRNPAHSFRLDS